MQVSRIFSVYDRKAQYFLPVFNMRSNADAMRQFSAIVTQSDTDVSKYPADFDLICLAQMDLETGQVSPVWPVEVVINGLVALQAAQAERARYAKVLSNPQMDIEEVLAGDA